MHFFRSHITTLVSASVVMFSCRNNKQEPPTPVQAKTKDAAVWQAPDTSTIPHSPEGDMIRYGRELIAHTATYLGPKGSIRQQTNGMNCQNCHLDAGTKPWGNNYSGVYATYPRFRARSGSRETMVKRVNDCLSRSLNGKPLDSTGREMKAILAYMQWLGREVPKGKTPAGSGIKKLAYLNRAADPQKGKQVYETKCQRCHGADGQGIMQPDQSVYVYPPLWGPHSYNTAAGLYRLSSFAGYVKDNMPFGINYRTAELKDEEAWDVAAFVNSQPRPVVHFVKDWPVIASKPIDHPFGPYADTFSQQQHKYGPFGPIQQQQKLNIH